MRSDIFLLSFIVLFVIHPMRQRFERRSMGNHALKRVVFFWIGCSVIFFVVLVSIYFFQKLQKRNVYISPLSKQNQNEQTNNVNTIKTLLTEKNLSVSVVSPFDDTSYYVKLATGEEAFFSSKKSLVDQVSSLQLVLSRLTIEGKHVLRIDFRFDTPVITDR